MEQKQKDDKRFITPGGAGLAAICFFLPWVKACGQDVSGVQIANQGGESSLWLVLIAAIVIVGAFFMYEGQNTLRKLKPIVVISAGLALLVLLIKYTQIKKDGSGMFEIEFGAIGTLLGFVASLFGIQFLEDAEMTVTTATTTAVQTAGDTSSLPSESISPDSWTCRCGALNASNTACSNCKRAQNAIY